MIPELQVFKDVPSPAKRVVVQDLTVERLESFREAVIDFCKRCKSPVSPMYAWSHIFDVLNGKNKAELWWVVEGNKVRAFLEANVYPDFDGGWTAYILWGWTDSM